MNKNTRNIIALSFVRGLGDRSIVRLLEDAEDTEDIFDFSESRISSVTERRFSSGRDLQQVRSSGEYLEEIDFIESRNIGVITYLDKEYPAPLKEIYDPPPVIFIKGEMKTCDIDSVAVVGARRCSLYGSRVAAKLARELASSGITVVSGMARGIDSSAHNGAIQAGGRTIAVIGSGFRNMYPPESEGLARKIAATGCVITEHVSRTAPLRQNFPKRNRIISALSRGVVVVEAGKRSGALITAYQALEQGRDVFAVPGRIDQASSSGSNRLLKEGARLVESSADILDEIAFSVDDSKTRTGAKRAEEFADKGEKALWDILEEGKPVHLDELMEKTEDPTGILCERLMKLQIKGKIKECPGKMYLRT